MFHLHSSMVRLETMFLNSIDLEVDEFTFQYGQIRNPFLICSKGLGKEIYIPVWLDQKLKSAGFVVGRQFTFTFQYGQIRNRCLCCSHDWNAHIYIPVWLDQKPIERKTSFISFFYLHSSMVRLETKYFAVGEYGTQRFTFQYGQIRNRFRNFLFNEYAVIYIPVWLDQKLVRTHYLFLVDDDLHSSMVRLETYLNQKLDFL